MPRWINVLAAIVIVIWAGFTTYTEIIDADPDQYSIKSAAVKQQVANCNGTFEQRQACAEKISTAREQLGFLVWCEKVVIILGPPLVLWGLMNYATRQRQKAPARPAPVQRRVAAAASQRRTPRRDMEDDSPSPEPSRNPESGAPKSPDSPVFSGGRREPVRRRTP